VFDFDEKSDLNSFSSESEINELAILSLASRDEFSNKVVNSQMKH
jgi:hypothetical protein